ncbi:MAG: UDP-N-acetylmuramoyl-tripeptide--D-alanyl-D-alanine ligase [Gammaproteobacteria bacterium]|nr:UDP-N-acetylmuramoyl-tripeptide--D-alanyl-D-alanine ligase [Gammaproteobacteria bacterium]
MHEESDITISDSSPLWTWKALCAAVDIHGEVGPDVTGICIDSRRARPGDLFVALCGDPGPRFHPSRRSERDGHDYISDAVANGAVGVLVHDDVERSVPQLRVVDTLDGLWALGAAARARLTCPVVAVTGSSGKTTTKTLLAEALAAFATSGSLNNHLGVPLSLALTPEDASAVVYEIGTSRPGEIAPLSKLVRPDIAVVLNVHPAHAEYFADLDELRAEKLSICTGLSAQGQLIVEDLIDTSGLPETQRLVNFGRSENADIRCLSTVGENATYRLATSQVSAHIPGGGLHRALSLAAVLAVLQVLGRAPGPALALSDELIPAGRGRVCRVAGIIIIDDSYNANPASMRAALAGLDRSAGPLYAVLGEMLELGADSERYHRGLANETEGLTGVICVGSGMQALYDLLPVKRQCGYFPAADATLIERLRELLHPGDRVLIKGSNRVFWAIRFVELLTRKLEQQQNSG